jgi:hypothetical protein
MGHVDTKSMEPNQHHDLSSLREATNRRNEAGSGFGHILVTLAERSQAVFWMVNRNH